jgi:hypothetical protein
VIVARVDLDDKKIDLQLISDSKTQRKGKNIPQRQRSTKLRDITRKKLSKASRKNANNKNSKKNTNSKTRRRK